jgi:membrane associated rhomboid family serine protease
MSTALDQASRNFKSALKVALWTVGIIWGIHLLQVLTGADYGTMGIYPRRQFGLKGILFSPLLHSGWKHLIANTPPLFVLTGIMFFFYRRVAVASFTAIYFLTGLAVWSFARPDAFHIGASGVVYGLVAFVFWTGIFRRNIRSIVLSLIVVVYYGGMFAGILPTEERVSWESHLFGALVGIFVAFWFKNRIEPEEKRPTWSWEQEGEAEKRYFLERDAFNKTKTEREQEKERDGDGWYSTRTW